MGGGGSPRGSSSSAKARDRHAAPARRETAGVAPASKGRPRVGGGGSPRGNSSSAKARGMQLQHGLRTKDIGEMMSEYALM
ncbi:hypothetical protein PF008_g246 [Phytophthora fragariae]|uniref:Uncharacterized protein n=1 Tax=Phytophthora fragariae TaxID=53985 RepID=A0A6G0SNJ3_9STRA|nr:hypothetical protein PF008_g246 [Phytophthora fragariae]